MQYYLSPESLTACGTEMDMPLIELGPGKAWHYFIGTFGRELHKPLKLPIIRALYVLIHIRKGGVK